MVKMAHQSDLPQNALGVCDISKAIPVKCRNRAKLDQNGQAL
jgi:hypothetical protein